MNDLIPGSVVAHSPAATRRYLGSPALASGEAGRLLVSYDEFGPGSDFDTTRVSESRDGGRTWSVVAEIRGMFWASLFTHGGSFYLLGTDHEYGAIVISRSDDGRVWSAPSGTGKATDVLFDGQYHCAPTPVVATEGRVWKAFELVNFTADRNWHPSIFELVVISCPEDALDDSGSWRRGAPLPAISGITGWLEGNVVATPTGLRDVARVHADGPVECAAVVSIDSGTGDLRAPRLIDFPGGSKKFTIRPIGSAGYLALVNDVAPPTQMGVRARNRLSLAVAHELDQWRLVELLLSGGPEESTGYQYVDWLVDGVDIIAAVRTAHYDGEAPAHSFHDSNLITFHRFEGAALRARQALEEAA